MSEFIFDPRTTFFCLGLITDIVYMLLWQWLIARLLRKEGS